MKPTSNHGAPPMAAEKGNSACRAGGRWQRTSLVQRVILAVCGSPAQSNALPRSSWRPSMVNHRSFVIIAVLVITASALFIATGALFIAQAEIAGSSGARAAAQSRALAWSGLQIVIGELNSQRDEILRGEMPRLDEQYEVYQSAGRAGVVRLLPVTAEGNRVVGENGKLDINIVNAEQLAATELIDLALAESIIAHRDSLDRPMQSLVELLEAPGMTPEILYGPLDEMRIMDAARGGEADLADRVLARLGHTEPRGLADIVTVFSFGPPLQRDGRLRINLNTEWSDELAGRLDDRFGEGTSEIVKRIIDDGTTFDSDRKIVEVLRFFQVEPEEWVDILDALRADGDEFYSGRLDLNSAPESALRALPTVTPEQATQILRARDGLGSEERATIVWPLLENILDSEQYVELVDKITVRSWIYRVRLAAGEVDVEEPDGELSRPVIWEAVIDLAAPSARVAYLRDVTLLETAAIIASNASLAMDEELDWEEDWWVEEVEEPDEDVIDEGDEEPDQEPGLEEDGEVEPDTEEPPADDEAGKGARIGRWKPG